MAKRVVDLTLQELFEASSQAWTAAARETLDHGLPVTGSHNGRRFRYYPNGHIEDLGLVEPISDDTTKSKRKKRSERASA